MPKTNVLVLFNQELITAWTGQEAEKLGEWWAGEPFLYLPEEEDGLLRAFKGCFWKRKSSKSSSGKMEDLEDQVGGEVIGGILHVLEWQL